MGYVKTDPAEPLDVKLTGSRTALIAHRAAVTATDKVAQVTATVADQAATEGVMAAVAHYGSAIPGNAWGSSGIGTTINTVTPTVNKTVDMTIAQVTGATFYDIFFSIDAAPKWVGRVTEAQRAAGCAITAVGTVGAGGSAGVVNIRLVGTGIQTSNAVFAANNAYRPDNAAIIAVDCTGKLEAIVTVDLSVTDLRTAPSLGVIPFFYDGTTWYAGTAQTLSVVAGAVGQPLKQTMYVDVEAVAGFKMLVDTIGGTGGSVNIGVQLV